MGHKTTHDIYIHIEWKQSGSHKHDKYGCTVTFHSWIICDYSIEDYEKLTVICKLQIIPVYDVIVGYIKCCFHIDKQLVLVIAL